MDDHYAMSICDKLERIANALEQIVSAKAAKLPEATPEPEPQQRTEIDWENDFRSGNLQRAKSALKRATENKYYDPRRVLCGYRWPLCVEDLRDITLAELYRITGIGDTCIFEMSEYFERLYGKQEWMAPRPEYLKALQWKETTE
jgi:hypothetical protein